MEPARIGERERLACVRVPPAVAAIVTVVRSGPSTAPSRTSTEPVPPEVRNVIESMFSKLNGPLSAIHSPLPRLPAAGRRPRPLSEPCWFRTARSRTETSPVSDVERLAAGAFGVGAPQLSITCRTARRAVAPRTELIARGQYDLFCRIAREVCRLSADVCAYVSKSRKLVPAWNGLWPRRKIG